MRIATERKFDECIHPMLSFDTKKSAGVIETENSL